MTVKSITPNIFERILAVLASLMLAVVVIAVIRGRSQWDHVPTLIWAHLFTIATSLVLTPVMFLRPRGTKAHRQIGIIWMSAMLLTAVISLFVRTINPGHFSAIHILSIMVIVLVVNALRLARAHKIAAHRRAIQGLVAGSLLIAGFFTFPFGRLLGRWLFGV